jgi:hypothetical protein
VRRPETVDRREFHCRSQGIFVAARGNFRGEGKESFGAWRVFDFGNSSTENRQTDMCIRRLKVKPG